MERWKLDGGGLAYIYAIVLIRVREDVLFVLESIEIMFQGVVLNRRETDIRNVF
jgi:hypothetical protein